MQIVELHFFQFLKKTHPTLLLDTNLTLNQSLLFMFISGAPPAPATSHSQYRHPNMAGDLAYYPAPGKNNPNSKSFSDTGFGMPAQPAMRMSTSQNQYAFQQSHVS